MRSVNDDIAERARAFQTALAAEDWPAALARADALERAVSNGAPEALPSILYNRALVLERLGRREAAIRSYRRALALAPTHANARFGLAAALMETGRLEEASTRFQSYLELVPDDAHAALNVGQLLVRLGRPGEALAYLHAARAALPGVDATVALALAQRDAGDLGACEATLATLPEEPANAALRLRTLTQGATGRLALDVERFRTPPRPSTR